MLQQSEEAEHRASVKSPEKMELCTSHTISNLPLFYVSSSKSSVRNLSKEALPLRRTSLSRTTWLLRTQSPCLSNLMLRATKSEEVSSGATQRVAEEPEGVATMEDVPSASKNLYNEVQTEIPKEISISEEEMKGFDILNNLNVKLDSEDTFPILLYTGGAVVVVWLASAVVGAIDSIPVVPKLLEVVGLGYIVWFSTRYLIFKKNREELSAKIEELKQQVLGSDD